MIPLLGLILLSFLRDKFGLHSAVEMSCLPFHQICLEALPAGDFKSLSAGLICGAPLPVEETTAQLRGMGMAHIIVVSGAHLLWLEHGYRKLTPSTFHFLIGPLLLIYCGVSLFQPPAVRSLFHWTASTVSERYGLNWSLENRLTISLLLSLMFQPAWSTSLSLMLSWLAGLGVCLGQQAFPKSPPFQQVVISSVLLPALGPFGGITALQLASNILITPVVAAILFPLAALGLVFPPAAMVQDLIWYAVFGIGDWLSPLETLRVNPPKLSAQILWAYSLAILAFLTVFRSYSRLTRPR